MSVAMLGSTGYARIPEELAMMRIARVVLSGALAACVTFAAASVRADDDIEAFGRACAPSLIPDELRTQTHSDLDESYREAVCRDYYHGDSSDVGGGGTVLVIGVLGVDGSGHSITKQVTKDEYCRDTSLHVAASSATDFFQKHATPEMLQAWLACMQLYAAKQAASTPSPLVTKVLSISRTSVTIGFRWNPAVNPDGRPLTFRRVRATGLTCAAPDVAVNRPISKEGDGNAVTCSWPTVSEVGTVIIDSNRTSATVPVTRPDLAPEGTVLLVAQTPGQLGTVASYQACGAPVETAELHNTHCDVFGFDLSKKIPGADCQDPNGSRWLRTQVCAEIHADNTNESLANLKMTCHQDNDGACGWNGVGDMSRVTFTTNLPQYARACQQMGSRKEWIKLCGTINISGQLPGQHVHLRSWTLVRGTVFEVAYPRDTISPKLVVTVNNEVKPEFDAGLEKYGLKVLHSQSDELGVRIEYRYVGNTPAVSTAVGGNH
jgi:hypothetical protein